MATAVQLVLGSRLLRGGAITLTFVGRILRHEIMSENPHSLNSANASKVMSDLEAAIENDTLKDASPKLLRSYLSTLCSSRTGDTTNALHIVQGLVVNHEVLRRHITKLDAANGRTQKWFMVMAALSLIGLGVQIYRDLTTESVVAVSPAPSHPSVAYDTQKHDAASKVDPAKATPPPANE